MSLSSFHPRGLVAALLVLALLSVPPVTVRAYCQGWRDVDWSTIPVRLHPDLHNQLQHGDGTPWTRLELERAVRIAIARLTDSAGANIPYIYLDTTVAAPDCDWLDTNCTDGIDDPNPAVTCDISGVVHIVPSNCITTRNVVTEASTGRVIVFQRSPSGIGFKPWAHMDDGANTEIFESTMMHELGHVLGLWHPWLCSNWNVICPFAGGIDARPCAIMASNEGTTNAGDYWMPDDRDGLRYLWGTRPLPSERHFESNNLNNGVVEWAIGNIDGQGFFASSTISTNTRTTLIAYRRDVGSAPVAYSWNWSTFALTNIGNPWDHFTNGPLGAAQTSTTHYAVSSTYRMTNDLRRWRRKIVSSSRPTNLSSGWVTVQSDPAAGSIGDTVTGGISAIHDTMSGSLLYAFRSTFGSILLQAGTSGALSNTGVRAYGTPSISCAPIVGYNCIAVSVEPGWPVTTSSAPRLRWFRFRYSASSGWTIDPTGLVTEPWIMHAGDPQVTTYWNGSAYEHVVVYRQQINTNNYVYLLRMPATGGASFSFYGQVLQSGQTTRFVAAGAAGDLELYTLTH